MLFVDQPIDIVLQASNENDIDVFETEFDEVIYSEEFLEFSLMKELKTLAFELKFLMIHFV